MVSELRDAERVQEENQLLRAALLSIARTSLDTVSRVEAKKALRKIDPSVALEAERNDAEIYGEWCI